MGVMKKVELSHTVLYCKGWYKITDHIEDLKKTLLADGYTVFSKRDIMLSLVARIEDSEHHRISAFDVLNALNMKATRRKMFVEEPFTYEDLVIDYCIELMLSLDNKQWNIKEPDYKILPKRK